MGAIRDFDVWSRIGVQADRTTKAVSFIDLALRRDGMQLRFSKESQALETEHRYKGTAYRTLNRRNAEEGQLLTYLFPDSIGTFFDAVFQDSNGQLGYLTLEHYWDATLNATAGNQDVGIDVQGIIFNGLSLTVDRGDTANAVEVDYSCFVNSKENLDFNVTRPTFTLPPSEPYASTGILVDFVGDNTSGNFGGDNEDVLSVSMTYSNNVQLKVFRSNSVAKLNKTWTKHFAQTPTLTFEIELEVADDDYLRYDEGADLIEGSMRLVGRHPDASMVTTTTETITKGDQAPHVITLADATGSEVGDVVVFIHRTSQEFVVHAIDALSVNDITIDTQISSDGIDAYVTLDGSTGGPLDVENMAFGLIIPRMTLTASTPPATSDGVRTMTLTYEADLLVGETGLVTYFAYNHNSTTHA